MIDAEFGPEVGISVADELLNFPVPRDLFDETVFQAVIACIKTYVQLRYV